MPTSKSRLSYPDCESFLNAALEDERGARLPFLTEGQATQFRVRCHYFRTIVREDNAEIYTDREHPMHGRSEYDVLALTILPTEDRTEFWVYARKMTINESEIERLSDVEGSHGSSAA